MQLPFVCMYIYVCICIYNADLYVCIYTCLFGFLYVSLYVRTYLRTCTCIFVYVYVHIHVCLHACMPRCAHISFISAAQKWSLFRGCRWGELFSISGKADSVRETFSLCHATEAWQSGSRCAHISTIVCTVGRRCIFTYACRHVYVCMYVCIYMYVVMFARVLACLHVCVHAYMNACMKVSTERHVLNCHGCIDACQPLCTCMHYIMHVNALHYERAFITMHVHALHYARACIITLCACMHYIMHVHALKIHRKIVI